MIWRGYEEEADLIIKHIREKSKYPRQNIISKIKRNTRHNHITALDKFVNISM